MRMVHAFSRLTGLLMLVAGVFSVVFDIARQRSGEHTGFFGQLALSLSVVGMGVLLERLGRLRHHGWWIALLSVPFLVLGLAVLDMVTDQAVSEGLSIDVVLKAVVGIGMLVCAAALIAAAAWWNARRARSSSPPETARPAPAGG